MAIERRPVEGGKTSYRVRLLIADPETGRRRNLTIGTYRTRRAAEKAERRAKDELDAGTLLLPSVETVGDLLAAWLRGKASQVTNNTLKDYEMASRLHLTPALGTVRVQSLTPSHVQRLYERWLGEGMSPRMVHRCHIVLSQALAEAVRLGVLSRNVCTGIRLPRIERSAMQVWTPEEVGAFLDVAKLDAWAPLWYLLALEGLRRGEALGLRWSDLNTARGTAHIVQTVVVDRSIGSAVIQDRTKTRSGARSVRLTRQTLAALEIHRDRQRFGRQQAGEAWRDHDLIVCTGTGGPVNPNNVTRSYNLLVQRAGVPRIRLHDMRHTAFSLLLRAGVSPKVIQERAGHGSIAITMDVYGHIDGHMQDTAADAMSDLLDRVGGG